MNTVTIHTQALGPQEAVPPREHTRAFREGFLYEVRLVWRGTGSRYDRLAGEVWRLQPDRATQVEDCCVLPRLYRDRASGQVVPETSDVLAEIRGQLVPAPRSSREMRP